MRKSFLFAIIFSLLLGLWGCNNPPDQHWSRAIPQKTPAAIVPSSGLSPTQALGQEYMPFVDDITSSAVQLLSEIDSYPNINLQLHALLLYPGVEKKMQPLWLIQAPGQFANKLHQAFYKDFTQNKYRFHGQTVYKLHIKNRVMFASQLHNLLVLSESSLAVEDAIRSYLGRLPAIDLENSQLQPASLVLNTPSLDHWVEQVTQVAFKPQIKGAFSGTGPAVLELEKLTDDKQNNELRFTGNIPLVDGDRSELVSALSSENAPITLDRFISSNASSFGIFRLSPRLIPTGSLPDTTRLDSLFLDDTDRYGRLARTLDPEFALVTYSESGFLSTGEHLYLRRLGNSNQFLNQLAALAEDGLVRQLDETTYFADSQTLANMIGSELCGYSDFYLDVTGDVVVISKRRGLAEIVESDRRRRRVIYYEQDYMNIRNNLPEEISGYLFANTDFYEYIQSFLNPETYINAITSKFNQLTMSFQIKQEQQLAFEARTYTREETDIPYEEQWFFPTGGAKLSGKPVLANLRGSPRDEIVFATTSGTVYALASDGTTVMQTNTGSDQPVGSPVVYDWYGTNQQVILLAAGNKIYGWNDTGTSLPKFPFTLDEIITTPLTIADIDRNGLPDAVVATANRQLHALDGRGNDLSGWPVTTNAVVNEQPVIDIFRGSISVVAFSENAVHAWNADGSLKDNFPIFINASLNGSPLLHESNVLGSAADGYLYSVGGNPLFADSLNVYSNRDQSNPIEAVYVSNNALMGTPSVHTLIMQEQQQAPDPEQQTNDSLAVQPPTFQEQMFLAMSSNGSVFLINQQGQLRLTKNMGQPAAQDFSPFITDINSDGLQDIITLASFGRLYAWQVLDGERIYSLPTSGMQHPIVTDLDGDGNKELIAQTSEGIRSWTIYQGKE